MDKVTCAAVYFDGILYFTGIFQIHNWTEREERTKNWKTGKEITVNGFISHDALLKHARKI